jgi:alpha-beta hydrolase superfamily lysophospholipase
MKREEGRLRGVGDLQIYWQAWLPEKEPQAAVVLAHGVSEHSERYAHVGRALTDAGYALYALDHRGHGRSEGDRANIERLDHVVADLLTLVETVTGLHGEKPFLLGHSMGGAVAVAFTLEHEDTIAGLLLSAPAADASAASPVERVLGRLTSAVAPNLGVFKVHPEGVSRDPEVVRAYVEDPLVFHRKLPARTVSELVTAIHGFPDRLPRVTLPLLVMHGGDDPIVPLAASRMIEERAGSADKTLIVYDGLYHEILNEPEQDQVLADIVGWLDSHSS